MARVLFTQSLTMAAPIDTIKSHFLDMSDLTLYHPLIVGITEIDPDTSIFGTPRRRFTVTDRMRVAGINTRFSYLATSTLDDEGQPYCEAFQSPGIHLAIRYRCTTQDDGQVEVMESCTVEAPAPLVRYISRQAQMAHKAMLERIKVAVESAVIA